MGLSRRDIVRQADALDARRRSQIKNQIDSINRLLDGDHTYDKEMEVLHAKLAERDARIVELEAELRVLTGRSLPEDSRQVRDS